MKPGKCLGWIHNGYVGKPTGGRAGWNLQKLKQWDHTSCAWVVHHDERYYYYCGASHARIVPEFLIATFQRASSVSKRAPSAFLSTLHRPQPPNSFSNPLRGLTCHRPRVSGKKQDHRLIAQVLKAVIDDMLDTSVAPRTVTLSDRSLARPLTATTTIDVGFWELTLGPNLSHERWGFSTSVLNTEDRGSAE